MATQGEYQGYSLLHTQEVSGSHEPPKSGGATMELQKLGSAANARGPLDVVQFACPFYYFYEDSGQAVVKVMRIGTLSQPCTVGYKTEDNSAKAGLKYVETEGSITFGRNEEMKQIEVPIIKNPWFEPNLDFKIKLQNPQACMVSETLEVCRCMVVDEDIFPDNKFRDNIMKQELDSVGVRMLISFAWFCIKRVPDCGRRTYWNLFLDQFHNANYLASIWLNVYLVDVVLVKGSEKHLWVEGSRLWTAVLVALALTLPKAVLSFIDYSQVGELAVAGKLRLHLTVNLFRKYLYYDTQSLSQVSPQDLLQCMDLDVIEVVNLGFVVIFQLAQQVVKVVVILYFLCHKRPSSALLLLPYPIGMAVVLNMRYLPTLKLYKSMRQAHLKIISSVTQWCDDLSLIKEYHMRSQVIGMYGDTMQAALGPIRHFAEYDFRTMLVMPWITNTAIAIFIVLGGYFVLIDELTLGAFLAIIGIYKDAGQIFSSFYGHLKNCYTVIGPLMRVVTLMNLGTNAVTEMRLVKERDDSMLEQLTGPNAITPSAKGVSRFDMLPIRLTGVSLATDHGGPQHHHLQNISMSIPQGKMVAVLGPHGAGKYTLLRLLKGSVVARHGQVQVPTHLRCICVPGTPQLFENGSLLSNVVFGVEGKYDKQRLLQLCRLVGLHKFSIAMITKEIEEAEANANSPKADNGYDDDVAETAVPWYEQMSRSELLKMHIIRALHNDPEILLLQRPVDELEADHAARILGLLRSYVDNKGILVSSQQARVARPHTVFFTSGQDRERAETASDAADIVLHLSERGFTQEFGGAHFQRPGLTGNKIINSWCQQAQQAQSEFIEEKNRHVATKGVLRTLQSELDTWNEEEQEMEDTYYPFVDRSETKVRLDGLRDMLTAVPDDDRYDRRARKSREVRSTGRNLEMGSDSGRSDSGHSLKNAFVLL
mmetsp:Transcript_92227/g.176901  ORF Transcript_92227/g.176901 Transcript_92227/m.176901 type:complete len:934 (-) Transcript_92227:265-3066(-)